VFAEHFLLLCHQADLLQSNRVA